MLTVLTVLCKNIMPKVSTNKCIVSTKNISGAESKQPFHRTNGEKPNIFLLKLKFEYCFRYFNENIYHLTVK